MGFEVKLFVGLSSELTNIMGKTEEEKQARYFKTYAEIELFKPGYDSKICAMAGDMKSETGTPIYMYGLDGDKTFTEDCYGKRLRTLPMPEVLAALEQDFEASKADYAGAGYWPFRAAVDVIKSAIQCRPEMEVVLYGH